MVRNKNQVDFARQMRRGQTIVAERERSVSDSERMNLRKKAKQKKIMSGVILIIGLAGAVVLAVIIFINIHLPLLNYLCACHCMSILLK